MSQQTNNNEKCQCTKKIVALDKQVKELKTELQRQKLEIEILKMALKYRG